MPTKVRKGTPRHKDRAGQRFGRLTALEFAGREKWGCTLWKCQCDCGQIIITRLQSLTGGETKSCGCLQKEIVSNIHRKEKGQASFNSLYYSYLQAAKKRYVPFTLTKDAFKDFTQQSCYYCGQLPTQIYGQAKLNGYYIYNGLDRLDPSKGYTEDNCVTACGTCNFAKQGLTAKQFLDLVHCIHRKWEDDNGKYKEPSDI